FHIAGLLLGFQGGLTSGSPGSLGGLCGGQGSSLLSFNGQLGGCSLSDTGIASHPDRVPCRAPLDSGRALGCRPWLGPPVPVGPFSHLPLRPDGRQHRCSWAHSSQSYTLKLKRPRGWGGFLITTSGGQCRC